MFGGRHLRVSSVERYQSPGPPRVIFHFKTIRWRARVHWFVIGAYMTKEQIYDEQISPLMTQIIAICNEHKIANVLTFSLDRDEGLVCTTCNINEDTDPPDEFKELVDVLFPKKRSPLMVTVDHGDGRKTINAIP